MAEVEKMEKGSTYDVIIKYPESIGSVKLNDLKLVGEFLGPDVIRQTIVPEIDTIWFNIKNEAGVDFVMSFKKKKKCLNDFIFSGTVGCECTEETYALVKSWLPESVRMPKVKF